jgi:ABC-type antimicrobial peptide transport system permease subunit
LGIAVGVAAVVSLSAFGEGFATGFESIFSTSDADLIVGQKDAVMLLMSSVDAEIQIEIRSIPGVEQVAGTVIGIVQMPDVPYFVVMGEDPRSYNMAHYRIVSGNPIAARRQILLGKSTAANFKKQPGDAFYINDSIYRVAGIYETGVAMEDAGAVMRLDDAQSAFNQRNKVNYFSVKVKDKNRIAEVKQTIESRWPNLAATRSGEATTQSESLDMYRWFGWFIGIFAILVGGLGMMNTSLMSVFERTREIGVLRAVGWGKARVMGLILGETLATAVMGGIAGIALGIGLTELVKLSPAVNSMLSGVLSYTLFLQAMVTAILLGVAGGVYPAWKAAQLQPVEAMRYDSGATGNKRVQVAWLTRLFSGTSTRNLWRRPLRTLITVVGIGIGVGFVVALIAMADGFIFAFNQITGAGQVDILAEESKVSDLTLS